MRMNNTGFVLGASALAGATILLGAAVARAAIGPSSASAPAPGDEESPSVEASAPASQPPTDPRAVGGEVLALAVESAPFDPEREAPSERYRFPEERIEEAPPPERAPPPEAPFRILGTIAGGTGGIVVVQAEGQEPKVLRLGEEMMGFRVSSIQEEVVVVSSQGWDLNLSVAGPDATRVASGGNRNRAGNNQNQNENSRERTQQQGREAERVQDQVRETIEGLSRQLQQGGGGPVRVEIQNGRAVLMGPDGVRREIAIPGGGNQAPATTIRVRPPGGGR